MPAPVIELKTVCIALVPMLEHGGGHEGALFCEDLCTDLKAERFCIELSKLGFDAFLWKVTPNEDELVLALLTLFPYAHKVTTEEHVDALEHELAVG